MRKTGTLAPKIELASASIAIMYGLHAHFNILSAGFGLHIEQKWVCVTTVLRVWVPMHLQLLAFNFVGENDAHFPPMHACKRS